MKGPARYPGRILANERTYLAWLRTGLALVVAGVAAERVLPAEGILWARQLIGVTLILACVVTAAGRAPLAQRRPCPARGTSDSPSNPGVHGATTAYLMVLAGLEGCRHLTTASAGHCVSPPSASPSSFTPMTRHSTATITALLWVIQSLSPPSSCADRFPVPK